MPSVLPNVPYDPVKDFVPVTLCAAVPNVMVINPKLPVNSVREQMRDHIRAELDTWNEEAKVPLSAIGRTPAREVAR